MGAFVRDAVVRARPHERVKDVRQRVEESPYGFALVVAGDGTLVGRLRRKALEEQHDRTAADAMEEGPSTVRFDGDPEELAEKLRDRDLRTAIVTDPDGRLFGVVTRKDLEGA